MLEERTRELEKQKVEHIPGEQSKNECTLHVLRYAALVTGSLLLLPLGLLYTRLQS